MTPLGGESLKDLTSLQEKMNKMFGEAMKRIREFGEKEPDKPWTPAVDIFELPDSFVLLADLAGIPKEHVTVEVMGGSLVIKGERPRPLDLAGAGLYRSERHYGGFERTFNLPVDLATGSLYAKLNDGVLHITISKPDQEAQRVKVDID